VLLPGGFSEIPWVLARYRLAGRLVFLFLLRSLFLGCHEVISSVNFFPCKVSSVGRVAFTNVAQLLVWAHLLIQDIAAVLQACQQISCV
jgi:hypothetical protein